MSSGDILMMMEVDDRRSSSNNNNNHSHTAAQNGIGPAGPGNGVVVKAEAESTTTITVDEQQQPTSQLQQLVERMIKPSSYGQRRNYSSIDISAEKWLMAYDAASLAKLESPPSLADGISNELEKDIRYLGCELIQSGAILLKLSQTAAATGQILFQRFYYQKSFVRYNFEHMVMSCLLLASKIEEEPRKPRDVLNVYHRLKQLHQHQRRRYSVHLAPNSQEQQQQLQQQHRPKKFEHLELGGRQYQHIKNALIKAERRLLNTLGFVVHVHHPHKLIYIYLHILGLLKKEGDANATREEIHKSRDLLQRAWSYMNDGLRTDMFLRYTPETIACACIQLASKTVDQPFVLPKEPFPWFELFDASDRDVKLISLMLLELYTRSRAPSLDYILAQLEKQQQKLADEEKSRQQRDLAVMKDAIIQRKSETNLAALGKTEQRRRAVEKAIEEVAAIRGSGGGSAGAVAVESSSKHQKLFKAPKDRSRDRRDRSRERDRDGRRGGERSSREERKRDRSPRSSNRSSPSGGKRRREKTSIGQKQN